MFLLLACAVTLIKILFAFLDLTFPVGNSNANAIVDGVLTITGLPGLTVFSAFLIVMAVLLTLGYALCFFLLLSKQVFGLFIMIGLDLIQLLFWPMYPEFILGFVLVAALRWLVLGLPWLFTWIDLKRRGALAPD